MNHLPGSPPGALAPLYGREHDLRQLLKLLQGGVRLLTLRGPGGIGKTALVLHLAHALRQQSAPQFDHVQFVDLSAVREPEQVMGLIAASLPDSDLRGIPLRQLQDFAARRPTLLILDNFEQLLPAAPALADVLACTNALQLVVTSRAALRLHDETEYPVSPLALPRSAQSAAASGAVQLFVARVHALNPTFVLSETNAVQVTRLCEVLEGMPLALELAAMRTRSYALGDLLTQLDHPLDVLKADFRDRPERLQSLRATVQWSYDLLDDTDRAVFECCAVFAGPFTPQALAEVWGSSEVLERAEVLLEQSLLQRLDMPDTLWKMLQPLKELALEHLEGHPQEAVWCERHARHFLNLAEEYQRRLQREGLNSFESDLPHYPNIRAGLIWTVERRRSDLAYRFLGAVGGLWAALGLHVQEAPLVDRVLALPPPEDRGTLLRALETSAHSLDYAGQFQVCEVRLGEIMALYRELGDVEGEARASLQLAAAVRDAGQGKRAWEITQRTIRELRERVGDNIPTREQQMLQVNVCLAACHDLLELEQYAQALESVQLARQHFMEVGGQASSHSYGALVGHLLVSLHRLPEAQTVLLASLREAVDKGLWGMVNDVLRWGLIFLAAEQRDWAILVQFTAFVNDPVGERSQGAPDRRMRLNFVRAREELGEAGFQQAWTTGTQLQIPDIVELADRLALAPISTATHPELTPRELEVLTLVTQGHPDRKVAQRLNISPGTASKHVANLLGKLGLHNRVELTRWAMEHGLAAGAESRSDSP
ncbi:ATP-binding protein [Deinococcus marmoris]|uniref:ATP-binding protein n=1 Tax=Deinococcus marmoris TaxID=249408 RepID=UPI000496CE66|nr:LuxR C-terminal-related transcriptional regulator [Deinococcus marmoris]